MHITIDDRWRVDAHTSLDLPLSASAVWGQMRDLPRFLTIDPLHARVRFTSAPTTPRSPRGRTLLLAHRLLGVGPDRVGRVLTWNEGRGYAVSDLSRRGPRAGFPHICEYRVDPVAPDRSRLTFAARGRWTATRLPRPLVRLWLGWVLLSTEHHLRAEFARYVRWRAAGAEDLGRVRAGAAGLRRRI